VTLGPAWQGRTGAQHALPQPPQDALPQLARATCRAITRKSSEVRCLRRLWDGRLRVRRFAPPSPSFYWEATRTLLLYSFIWKRGPRFIWKRGPPSTRTSPSSWLKEGNASGTIHPRHEATKSTRFSTSCSAKAYARVHHRRWTPATVDLSPASAVADSLRTSRRFPHVTSPSSRGVLAPLGSLPSSIRPHQPPPPQPLPAAPHLRAC
jgi:hypothetical protein